MPEREGTEPLRERYLRGVVEALIPQEDHRAPAVPGAPGGMVSSTGRGGGIDAGDDGPDLAGQSA